MKTAWTILMLLTLGSGILRAQEDSPQPDTNTQAPGMVEGKKVAAPDEPTKNPKKAMLLSAIIPSAGQFYNEKYWKMPIVLGGIATAVYFARHNRSEYLRHRDAYRLETDDDPSTQSEFADQNITPEGIRDIRDQHKQWMELSYASIGLVYLLQIVDAYVDAHLFDFNVSDDLSARLEPQVSAATPYSNNWGLKFTLNLNRKKHTQHYGNSRYRLRENGESH